MKNNNTKVISGISAVLMCAALFAGCSSKTENKPFTVQAETLASADVTTAAETEKAASEGYKVIVNDQNGGGHGVKLSCSFFLLECRPLVPFACKGN